MSSRQLREAAPQDLRWSPDRVIMADWSASSSVGPAKPSPDRCWIAWADREDPLPARPAAEYFRTRTDCEARIADLTMQCRAMKRSALVGFDFAIGYPLAESGGPVLPTGRELCRLLDVLVIDTADAANNRFEVAGELNAQIREKTGASAGPFWGHPPGRQYQNLTFKKSSEHGVAEFRAVEQTIRRAGLMIQSAWKLAGAASVGSQSILGLPTVHRLLTLLGDAGRLWPFESIDRDEAIAVAEIWPSLADPDTIDHPIKDARQVLALRDRVLAKYADSENRLLEFGEASATQEGWILGAGPDGEALSLR